MNLKFKKKNRAQNEILIFKKIISKNLNNRRMNIFLIKIVKI